MNAAKQLYRLLGWLSLVVGAIGIVVPVLPTTPFLLVAVWAFSRSSPELAQRIRNHATFGPYVRDWEEHGVIPINAKLLAAATMAAAAAYLIVRHPVPGWATASICATMGAVAVYIFTRPSRRKDA